MLFIIILSTLVSSSLGANESIINDGLFDSESVFGTSLRRNLNFVETAAYDGYGVECHYVTTKDGYILGVFRIKKPSTCEGIDLGPMIWMHGLFLSADCGILKGKDAQCYVYANACYDVWMPNVRGNKYSENHTTLNPCKDMEFWNYDFDEMALMDLPAIIDYVLLVTGKTQIIYVAHSQGVTMMIILCSLRPEYNSKVKVGFGMSSACWLYHSRIFILIIEALLAPGISTGSAFGFHGPILKYRGLLQKTADYICGSTTLAYPICSAFVFALFGYNNFELTPCVIIDAVGHEPPGASIDLFGRWGDVRACGFRQRNYGALKNMEKYGCPEPPKYPLKNVIIKWIFISSDNDYVSDPKDLKIMLSELCNCNYSNCHLSDPCFGHVDYIFGKSSKLYCADLILSYLRDCNINSCKGVVTNNPNFA